MSFWLDDDDDDGNNNNPFSQISRQSAASSHKTTTGAAAASGTSTKKTKKRSAVEAFECENCGGSESYDDNATGMLVCAVCFTQSQTQTQETQEATMDYDEIMAVAAKTATGGLMTTRRRTAPSHKKVQAIPPGIVPDHCSSALATVLLHTADGQEVNTGSRKRAIHTLDKSQALPDTQSCIQGMQRVLQEATRILVVDLLELDIDNRGGGGGGSSINSTGCLSVVDEIVKKLWLSYLNCWAEAVQHYGAIYPEVRFSFRDYFLSPLQRASVIETLSYRAFRQIKQQQQQGPLDREMNLSSRRNQHENDDDDEEEEDSSDSSNDNDDSFNAETHDPMLKFDKTKTTNRQKIAKRRGWELGGSLTRVTQLPRLHRVDKSKGRFEAALLLRPSMTMVATILWLGVARSGVTPHQIVAWIANGTLPLVNAYDRIILRKQTTSSKKKERRKSHNTNTTDDNSYDSRENAHDVLVHDDELMGPHPLKPVQNFFRMTVPPLVCTVEAIGTLLMVAAGIKSRDIFAGVPELGPKRKDGEAALPTPLATSSSTLVRPGRANNKKVINTGQARKFEGNMIRTLPVASIPLVTAQLVTDLGLTVCQDTTISKSNENNDEETDDESLNKTPESSGSRKNKIKNSNDNGGGQAVLNVALALMGIIKGGPQDGLPRSLPCVTPVERGVSSLAHVLAILLCSCIILEPAQPVVATSSDIRELEERKEQGWWRFIRQSGPAATVVQKGTESSDDEAEGQSDDDSDNERRRRLQRRWVPWTEDQSRFLGNGSSLEGYLEFLEESVIVPAKKNSLTGAGGLENSFLGDLDDVPSSAHEVEQKRDRAEVPADTVRPSAQVAPGGIMSLILPAGTSEAVRVQSASILRQRIFHALYIKKPKARCDRTARISKKKMTGASIVLNPAETLQLEFLAHTTQTPTIQIRMALEEVLS